MIKDIKEIFEYMLTRKDVSKAIEADDSKELGQALTNVYFDSSQFDNLVQKLRFNHPEVQYENTAICLFVIWLHNNGISIPDDWLSLKGGMSTDNVVGVSSNGYSFWICCAPEEYKLYDSLVKGD